MTLTRDRVGALFFLALSVAYYVMATQVELYPGDEDYPMNLGKVRALIG